MPSLPPEVLRFLCSRMPLLVVAFALLTLALILSIVSIVAVDLDSATYTISIVNIVGILVLMSLFGRLIWICVDGEVFQYRDV